MNASEGAERRIKMGVKVAVGGMGGGRRGVRTRDTTTGTEGIGGVGGNGGKGGLKKDLLLAAREVKERVGGGVWSPAVARVFGQCLKTFKERGM